jgi:agmatine/peptidylarginine deiminase
MLKKLLVLLFISSTSAYAQYNSTPGDFPATVYYGKHPELARMPAEWEELQAVIMAWPYLKVSPQDDAKAIQRDFKKLTENCWIKIAAAVQEECDVWIKIRTPEDSLAIKKAMTLNGTPLKNYRFIVAPGENFWVRDFGPMFFYYGTKDSIGVIDARYHRHQSEDNDGDHIPVVIADMMKAAVVNTPLYYEAGNIDTDGYGNAFFTSRVHHLNSAENGWSREQTYEAMQSAFHVTRLTELRDLPCDGGTGHVDMFFKLLNEQTIALTEYPSSVTSSDRTILEENLLKIKSLSTPNNAPYHIVRVPMPTSDNGKYENASCVQLNTDPRTYINGIFVNKTFILPVFSDSATGNVSGDMEVVNLFKKNLPGYKIVPVDSRLLSVMRGGIHCITMQVPAENPIRFMVKKFPNGVVPLQREFPVEAVIANKDGIRVTSLHWRKKGSSEWAYQRLKEEGANTFSGKIYGDGFRIGDTVEYYFQAKSFNGKKLNHPITAPEGYYQFTVGKPQSDPTIAAFSGNDEFTVSVAPSPAQENATVFFTLQNESVISVTITDVNGQELAKLLDRQTLDAGRQSVPFWVSDYPEGMYACLITSDEKILAVKKFFVKR